MLRNILRKHFPNTRLKLFKDKIKGKARKLFKTIFSNQIVNSAGDPYYIVPK